MKQDIAEIAKLAERLESANGADRGLDGDIDRLLHVRPKDGEFDAGECAICARPYTASLDAAMTLVPEGWDHMEVYRPDHQTLAWTVHLMPNANLGRETWEGFAQSFPLALCAAALRARSILP